MGLAGLRQDRCPTPILVKQALRQDCDDFSADAGLAGVGSLRLGSIDDPVEVVMASA
jgi:hypothetical protein